MLFSDERSPRQICAILCSGRKLEDRPPHLHEEIRYESLTGRSIVWKKSFGDSDPYSTTPHSVLLCSCQNDQPFRPSMTTIFST